MEDLIQDLYDLVEQEIYNFKDAHKLDDEVANEVIKEVLEDLQFLYK